MLERDELGCEQVREAVSARHDDEDAPWPAAAVERHLSSCSACADHRAALTDLEARTIVAAAAPAPERVEAVVAAIERRRARAPRMLVGAVGAAQVALGLPGLLAPHAHLLRDLAVWELALGAALLYVARRPDRAAGLIPMVAVLAVAGVVAGAADLLAGTASAVGELSHLLPVVAVAILHRLAGRRSRARLEGRLPIGAGAG